MFIYFPEYQLELFNRKIQIIVKTIIQIKRLKKYEIKAVNSIYQIKL
jgi:hypothetical protein